MKTVIFLFLLLSFFNFSAQIDSIPVLNSQILDFVKTNIGKKVGKGECWDLAKYSLDKVGAKWDGKLNFGKVIDIKKEKIYPGDILQFENVQIEFQDGSRTVKESYIKHNAIVYQVISKNEFFIAQQNTNSNGKKVSIDKLYYEKIKKGKITFYRPEK